MTPGQQPAPVISAKVGIHTPLPVPVQVLEHWQRYKMEDILALMNEADRQLVCVCRGKSDAVYLRKRLNSYLTRVRKQYAKDTGKSVEFVKANMDRFSMNLRVTPKNTWCLLLTRNPQVEEQKAPRPKAEQDPNDL